MRIFRRIALAAVLVLAGAGYAWTQLTPVPALPDAERRTEYNITGQTGPLNVGFALYGDGTDYQNWIGVYVNGLATSAYTLTSPSGTIGNITLPITDAQITFSSAQTGKIEIVGARRPRRTSQLSENRGVSAHDFNVIITDIIAQLRESWDMRTNRVVQVPPGETIPLLPPAASRANTNLTFDASGNPVASLPASGTFPISAAMAPVVNAATTANAANQLGVSPVPVGSIIQFAGFTAPTSFDFATGQAYSRVNFPTLLTALTSSQSGTCTNTSTTITGLANTAQFAIGQRIEGSRIPSLTNTIASIVNGTTITVAAAATSSGACTVQVFPYGNGDGLTTFNLPNLAGRFVAGVDSAAARLSSASGLGSTQGLETKAIAQANLPSYTLPNTLGILYTINTTNIRAASGIINVAAGGAGNVPIDAGLAGSGNFNTSTFSITGSVTSGGSGTAFNVVPPTIAMNYIIRVTP